MPDDYEFSAWAERTVAAGEITSFSIDASAATVNASTTGAVALTEASSSVTAPAGAEFDIDVALNYCSRCSCCNSRCWKS